MKNNAVFQDRIVDLNDCNEFPEEMLNGECNFYQKIADMAQENLQKWIGKECLISEFSEEPTLDALLTRPATITVEAINGLGEFNVYVTSEEGKEYLFNLAKLEVCASGDWVNECEESSHKLKYRL